MSFELAVASLPTFRDYVFHELGFADFALGRSYGLTDAVSGVVFEAPLIVRRVFNGTCPSDGCSILSGCLDDKCLPVLCWPSIVIDWPLACLTPFSGLAGARVDRLSTTSSCMRSKDSNLTSG